MGKPGFKAKAQELIKLMVDTIADKEYAKLASSIPPKPSWASYIHAEPTFENACLGFGKWLVCAGRRKADAEGSRDGGPVRTPGGS